MTNIDLMIMALKSLTKRKIRTALTILSVVIGATSIIVMVSLGVALDEKFDEELKNMKNITQIQLRGYNEKITAKEIEKIKSLENVVAISPIVEMYNLKLVIGGKIVGTFEAVGLEPSTMKDFGYEIEEGQGRLLDKTDNSKYSIVFGAKTIYGFDKKGKAEPWYKYVDSSEEKAKALKVDVLTSKFKLYTDYTFGVKKEYQNNDNSANAHKTFNAYGVGILKEKDDYSSDHRVFLPYEMLEKYKKEFNKANGNREQQQAQKGYEDVLVKCDDFNNVEGVVEQIKSIFAENKKEIDIRTEAEYIQSSKRMTSMIQALLGAIGGISLFIAAIGITNTMVMSIYERTKEIGVMKVIGARVSDIKKLFLLEATLIGFIGGFLGVLFSYLISYLMNNFGGMLLEQLEVGMGGMQKISSIPLWLALSSLVFASLIGLLAGYLPAKRVVKIEALKAIKSE